MIPQGSFEALRLEQGTTAGHIVALPSRNGHYDIVCHERWWVSLSVHVNPVCGGEHSQYGELLSASITAPSGG